MLSRLLLVIGLLCSALTVVAAAEAEVRTLASTIVEDVRAGKTEQAILRVQKGLRNGRISAAEARDILQLAVSVQQLMNPTAAVAAVPAPSAAVQPTPSVSDQSSSSGEPSCCYFGRQASSSSCCHCRRSSSRGAIIAQSATSFTTVARSRFYR